MGIKTKLKNILKRIFIITLTAGITINSIPLSTFAATIYQQEILEDGTVIEVPNGTDTTSTTESESESVTGAETEASSESESVSESETESTTEPESSTEAETSSETEVETESETETEMEEETETEETETEEPEDEFALKLEALTTDAESSLTELLKDEYVMALVYLCNNYAVKESPSFLSETVTNLASGYTVLITGVAVDTESNTIWYQVSFSVNGVEYTGYIEKNYLAYSNENFLAWEKEYVEPVEQFLKENCGVAVIYNDGEVYLDGYSSDVAQFPESYRAAMQALKNSHPNWIFVRQDTGLNWDDVVSNEMVGSRSLIYYTAKASFRGAQYDSKWYYASKEAVEYYLDPRNALTESAVFQFEQLTFNSSYHSVSAIQSLLNGTFMKGTVPSSSISYAQAFYNIGANRGISPFHLASRVVQEQGVNGGSPLISGTYSGYEGYYNYFNIGATSANPIPTGLARAKSEGWNTPYKSLEGGAKFIGNSYILQGQDTLYLQKFDVESHNGIYWHQYMQNIQAPTSEASTTRSQYNQAGALNSTFVFKVPVYNDMPETETLKLSTTSVSLKGGYDVTITYTINNKKSTLNAPTSSNSAVASVTKVSKSVDTTNNKVTGTVKVTGLKPGTSTIKFVSSGGATASCQVTVKKDTITLSVTSVELKAGLSDGSCEGTSIDVTYTIDNPKSKLTTYKSDEVNSNQEKLLKVEKIPESVDSSSNTVTGTIRLTGVNPGTAKAVFGSQYEGSATCTATIVRQPESIEFEEGQQTEISVGNSMLLQAEVLPEDAMNKNIIWSSSDESIATVNAQTGRVTGVSSGTVTITATAEEKDLFGETVSESLTVTVVPIVRELCIAAEKVELVKGETYELKGEITPEGAAEYILPGETENFYKITYQSSNTRVATVEEDGTITAVGNGNAVITATVVDRTTASNTKKVTCRVSVIYEEEAESPIPDYSYTKPEKISVYNIATDTEMTDVSYTMTTGSALTIDHKITPENADEESVSWESSRPSVIHVTENKDGTVTLLAGTKGTATVTVSTDIGVKKTMYFTVEEKYIVEKVSLDRTDVTLYVNGEKDVEEQEETGFYADIQLNPTPTSTEQNGIAYKWMSSNEQVAVVDASGKVTATGIGTAVITVQDTGGSGKFAQCTVTVERCVEKITLDYATLSLQPDKQITVNATVLPTDATVKSFVWESSNESLATVSQKGVVKVVKTAPAGSTVNITLKDTVTGISTTIPLIVADTACNSVALYENEGDSVNKSSVLTTKTLYQNGNDTEQTFVISAEGLAKDKSQIEGMSFYATSSNTKVAEVVKVSSGDGVTDDMFQVKAVGKGTANIKICAADGSGKSATVRVTVNVYPEQVQVQQQEVYLTKGASTTLKATVTPTTANDKNITWKFKDDIPVDGFQITAAGKVTVSKTAPVGAYAEFVAVTRTGGVISDSCTVRVVEKKVTSLKLNTTSLIMTGLGTTQLTTTIAPADASVQELSYTSSNEQVARVDANGKVTAVGFGTAVITVQTLDNSKKAQCKLTVTPIDKSCKLYAVEANKYIQSYALDVDSNGTLQIKDQFGKIYDNSMFTFTSSDSNIAVVSEDGVVTPNPAYQKEKNGKVTITAALTNDPYGRKVKFTVNVLTKEQAEKVSVTANVSQSGETLVNPEIISLIYPAESNTIFLSAEACNVYGSSIDTKLKWAVSDTSMASIKVDKDTKTATLTIKKAGSFYITCTANDTWQKNCKIKITSVDTRPSLEESKVAISKWREVETGADGKNYVRTDSFYVIAAKGFPIQSVTVTELKKGSKSIDVSGIQVERSADGSTAILLPAETLEAMSNGAYKAQLMVTVKGETASGEETTLEYSLALTLNVGNTQPKVTIKASEINLQNITNLQSVLTITAPAEVESIELVAGQKNQFDTRFEVVESEGSYSLHFVDQDGYKARSISGKAEIKLKGYEPVTVNITVKTSQQSDSIEPSESIVLDYGKSDSISEISLYNKTTKETLENYELTVQADAKLDVTKDTDGKLKVTWNDKTPKKNGGNVLVNVQVMALSEDGEALWANPVNVRISAKVYTVAPKVTLGTSTITLNSQLQGEVVETTVKTDRSNVKITESKEWKIERYDTKTKKYIECDDSDEVEFSYNKEGTLSVSMKKTMPNGTYKYRITGMVKDYEDVVVNVNVSVISKAASVKVTTKGTLDLVKRSNTTLQGTVKLTNTKASISSIRMMELDENGNYVENSCFDSIWLEGNSFHIRLLDTASMTTGKKTVPVEIVLKGVAEPWYTEVSFQVVESTPKVGTPKTQTIYKTQDDPMVVYDMNAQLPAGYRISTMEKVSVPDGIGVTVKDGRVTAVLTDESIKPGTYTIKVKLYFKGAQPVFGSDYGKAVEKTLKITVK